MITKAQLRTALIDADVVYEDVDGDLHSSMSGDEICNAIIDEFYKHLDAQDRIASIKDMIGDLNNPELEQFLIGNGFDPRIKKAI